MTVFKLLRHSLPALIFACGLGTAPLAAAQTTMAPMAGMAPATAPAPAAKPGKVPLADRFKNQSDAAARCPGDTVVWATLSKSHVFHLPGTPRYGKTKHGAYVCEKVALAAGLHASKN